MGYVWEYIEDNVKKEEEERRKEREYELVFKDYLKIKGVGKNCIILWRSGMIYYSYVVFCYCWRFLFCWFFFVYLFIVLLFIIVCCLYYYCKILFVKCCRLNICIDIFIVFIYYV